MPSVLPRIRSSHARSGIFLGALVWIAACATGGNPCAGGGDTTWTSSRFPDGRIRGDRRCSQKQLADGRFVNHGSYRVTFPNGSLALEGRFEDGKKEGVWSEYDDLGQKVAERYFEKGVEKAAAAAAK